jgi:hypothetical protein
LTSHLRHGSKSWRFYDFSGHPRNSVDVACLAG